MFTLFGCRHFLLLAFLVGGGTFASIVEPAQPGETQIAIIASSRDSLLEINSNSLREIYLKRVFVNSDGRPYVPVNLPAAHPLRNAFLSAVLQMNSTQMQVYWDRRYFQGVSPPFVLGSQRAVVKFVATTPGAIGYVQRCHVTPDVQVLLLIPVIGSAAGMPEKCPEGAAQ